MGEILGIWLPFGECLFWAAVWHMGNQQFC